MRIDEYVDDRSNEGKDVKADIEALRRQQAELQLQYDDISDTLDTLMTEVIPND